MTESVSARTPLSPTSRSTVTRYPGRAATDRAVLDAILDAALICHVGVLLHGSPVVVPTTYGRDGDTLYLHGSTGAGNLRAAMTGDVSVAVTLLDGVVYARSAMHFSMNYRSAVIHGRPVEVTDHEERLHALRAVVEHAAPGAWETVRPPTKKELAATRVLALDLTEASVKTRTGDSGDDPEDLGSDVWAGVLPVHTLFGTPAPNADLKPGVDVPDYVRARVAGDRIPV
ncbi:pyridoxamine 5'-phosphate oxidase family protein [Nocardia transvalensis]|uniref:pyridoxamine 5'-phosphate oxidase family protein n=1 Tax=Nocardia transvalensis TaxID=37333 RepID=UPI001892E10B|nr:pyridoxamine 5'-phosphate oxidase family protein [Nocardia transvalensis]MBF6330546.1 pyridoxamine 5'-phosphate oxidase family protein [Nocardia transvalensis]